MDNPSEKGINFSTTMSIYSLDYFFSEHTRKNSFFIRWVDEPSQKQ